MSILVVADHNNEALNQATQNVVSAASQIGGDITVLVAGENCAAVAEQAAKIDGVSKVISADNAAYGHQLAENIAALVVKLAADYSVIMTSASSVGKNFLPRVAALLDVEQISDISAVVAADTFQRPIYAGNAVETVKTTDATVVLTVRATSFDPAPLSGSAAVEGCDIVEDLGISSFVSEELAKSDRPELASADIVVSGGRGMGSGENFAIIEALADKLGAAIGASRAAVDAGFVPNDMQVGQTGKVVAPNLYIAVGISGAIQHIAGMKESKVIVAINKDEDAPIFQVADYGLVADLFDVVPELTGKL